jgi:hypothetical protein
MIMNALDIIMPLITVLALALALGMGVVLFRFTREERRRSDARVAALIEASAERVNHEDPFGQAEATGVKAGNAESPRVGALQAEADRADRFALEPFDLEVGYSQDAVRVAELFAEPERESPWGRRIAVAACVAAIVGVAGYVLLSRDTTMEDVSTRPVAVSAQQPPIELLSLRHSQQPGRLTITGLVQNPRNGVALSRVTATAFAFSADGTYLASGRAPLDFSTIGPGEESPFVVTVPVTGTVARYRVGFRGEDGRVIAHVDRRASGTMAARN